MEISFCATKWCLSEGILWIDTKRTGENNES